MECRRWGRSFGCSSALKTRICALEIRFGYDADLYGNQPELDTALNCGVTTDDWVYCWGNGALGWPSGFGLLARRL